MYRFSQQSGPVVRNARINEIFFIFWSKLGVIEYLPEIMNIEPSKCIDVVSQQIPYQAGNRRNKENPAKHRKT